MRIIRFLLSLFGTILLILALNTPIGNWPVVGSLVAQSPAGNLPPLAPFTSPFDGYLQNAEPAVLKIPKELSIKGLNNPVEIIYDDRLVPHIYAQNNHDLYYAQGFVVAQHRLWQMDFLARASAGQMSEIVGSKAIPFDKMRRRLGLSMGAQALTDKLLADTATNQIINAFVDGVNAYIESLTYKNWPFEFKLLNYQPQKWSPHKIGLLAMALTDDLTGNSRDLELTNALKLFDERIVNILYPDVYDGQDPIIPSGTDWDFDAITAKFADTTQYWQHYPQQNPEKDKKNLPQNAQNLPNENKNNCTTAEAYLPNNFYPEVYDPNLEGIGSNNWAVSGAKSSTGKPLLCNDPHLKLQLPSIWFEVELNAPDINCYGVSLPGTPGILIGFNKNIAWGITNSGRDVKDWYHITFKDSTRNLYLYDGQWKPTIQKTDTIFVRNAPAYIDTVFFTHHGPVVYTPNPQLGDDLALKWVAHQAYGNPILTFYQLNRAKNYAEYEKAIANFATPGQNIVFAEKNGNIAIWQQGNFPLKWQGQGRFVLDGSKPQHDWQGFIPQQHNPHILNPVRGFVSSANQHPTDPTYPYYYISPDFEFYRNRRINEQLHKTDKFSPQDLMRLQNDNYNLQAAELLPVLLNHLDSAKTSFSAPESLAFDTLTNWAKNPVNDPQRWGPSFYDAFFNQINLKLWDELDTAGRVFPQWPATNKIIATNFNFKLIDNAKTPNKIETLNDIINDAFKQSVIDIAEWQVKHPKTSMAWSNYRGITIQHLARIPSLSYMDLPVGGGKSIVNASTKTTGPSWRMVVALGDMPQAWGVLPGGQSGNPGSRYYATGLNDWAAGNYYELQFWPDPNQAKPEKILAKQVLKQ
ncbi:MAG: penicillin acylase family protein [Chitinophagales bacterium]|jgi:penicillin amidase|nr:penicillin acylase family protein [Chitinophagales bacterium]